VARLTPAHRDTMAEQAAMLPALAAFPAASRLLPTDELSFLEWCRSHGVEPPVAPDNVAAAMAQLAVA